MGKGSTLKSSLRKSRQRKKLCMKKLIRARKERTQGARQSKASKSFQKVGPERRWLLNTMQRLQNQSFYKSGVRNTLISSLPGKKQTSGKNYSYTLRQNRLHVV